MSSSTTILNAFQRFKKENKARIIDLIETQNLKNPDDIIYVNNITVTTKARDLWRALPDKQKQVYKKAYLAEMKQHKLIASDEDEDSE